MESLPVEFLSEWGKGRWENGLPYRVTGLSIDTRTIAEGELFAALKTDRRDGHAYLETAKEKGASGAIVETFRPEVDLPQLIVASVGVAMLEMSRAYRKTWDIPVVGVTGSCGKTSCKEVLRLILGAEETLCTKGNLNNLFGVPLTMLQPFAAAARHAVIEAGISERGEMKQLAAAIDPDWVIVTAIGPAHLEELESESNVAIEKGRLAGGKRVKGVFIGESCERYAGYLGGVKAQVVRPDPILDADWGYRVTGKGNRSTIEQRVYGDVLEFEYEGQGNALASNVALAIATAKTLSVSDESICEGLSQWKVGRLRGEWRKFSNGKVYVDCYNANPMSMKDALDTFVTNSPENEDRLFVIGCMEELGSEAAVYHEELGIEFPFRERDLLYVLGDESESLLRGLNNVGHDMSRCEKADSLELVKKRMRSFSGNVFLKGSRRYRLEETLVGLDQGDDASKGGVAC